MVSKGPVLGQYLLSPYYAPENVLSAGTVTKRERGGEGAWLALHLVGVLAGLLTAPSERTWGARRGRTRTQDQGCVSTPFST